MELRELAAFSEVARHLSFNRAADQLGYVQSTISAQIQALEQELGVQLFDRLGRSIALTDAGEALLPLARRILDLRDEARSAVDEVSTGEGILSGTIAISAPESLLTYRLPAVLTRFREKHPSVSIELHPTPVGRFRGVTRKAVAAGTVQIAFVLDTPLEVPGFDSEILREEPIVVIAPADYQVAESGGAASALDGETIIFPEAPDSGCVYRAQFEGQLADHHVTTGATLEFASIETVKQCVVSGMGVAALLAVAVEAEVASGRLSQVDWHGSFDTHTQMVWNARVTVTPAISAFMETAREVLSGPT